MSIALQNTRILRPISQIISEVGSERILRQAWNTVGLNPDIVAGKPLFIPYRITAGILESAARATGMKHFGAVCSKRLPYRQFDVYGRYVLSAPCLAGALYRGVRALRYILSHSTVHMRMQGDWLLLQFETGLDPGVGGARHLEEALPVFLANLVRSYVDNDWSPAWVELPFPKGTPTSDLEEIYGTEVRLGGRYASIAFHKSLLWANNPGQPFAEEIHLLRDIREMVRARAPRTFTETTRDMIELQIRQSDPSIEAVAEGLGIGVRTLQRKLMVESTSFQECLNEVRAARARDLLRETTLSPGEIANQLGYRETNSFRRAFRRWAGMSPSQYRASVRMCAGPATRSEDGRGDDGS